MGKNGPDFYDQPSVFGWYQAKRSRPGNANDTIEKPLFDDLAGNLHGLRILDLGCGDAGFGKEALRKGAGAYIGIEASHNMFEAAQSNLAETKGTVIHAKVEDWHYLAQQFDLAVSRLVLHYIKDAFDVFIKVYHSLVPGGRFVFSIEHPVITSCNRARPADTIRQDWIVDDYFETGRRVVSWMGDEVIKYHRTVEDYFSALLAAGFNIAELRESRPRRELFADEDAYRRRLRIPLMLFLAARRPPG